jgi:predicted O-methyltransferase YrrM
MTEGAKMGNWLAAFSRNRGVLSDKPGKASLEWINDWRFRISGAEFVMTTDQHDLHKIQSSEESFLLGKNRQMVEDVVKLRDASSIKNIVDIGIFKGGSVALYALVFEPKKLVAIEYKSDRVGPLDGFVSNRGLEQIVKSYYGTDQSDTPRVSEIMKSEFSGQAIDLVVDDASHLYPQTRESFQTLFPALRPGGVYIIEDWGWAHWAGDIWQKSEAFPADAPSLTNMLIEIAMLCASRPDIVAGMEIQQSVIKVIRGPAKIGLGNLQLDKECLNRGRVFAPVM